MIDSIEQEGFEIGNRGLSAVLYAPYRNDVYHDAWLRGWHRGFDAYNTAHWKTCLSCGARAETAETIPCGH